MVDIVTAYKFIGIGLATLAAAGAGIGIGIATGNACKAIAQQPEADGKIRSSLIIGAAMSEATAIYGFVIAILLMFVAR